MLIIKENGVNVGGSHPQPAVDTSHLVHRDAGSCLGGVDNHQVFRSCCERLWTRSKTVRSLRIMRLTLSTEWITVV